MPYARDRIHPRSLDAIAREIPKHARFLHPPAREALEGLRGRPMIAEALYPQLAVRAVRLFLEASAAWSGKRALKLKAELLDQIEDYERHQAELRRLEKETG